jgi:hypothetical protein
MTTLAHEITRFVAYEWENNCGYVSAVLSGIVGDLVHLKRGGYHISIEDQSSTNYSVIRIDDKAPPGNWSRILAAAIDMSMSTSDMALCMSRLWTVWNDQSDPRRIYLNAFNGWDGKTESAKRYDFVTQTVKNTTPDHKWHKHAEIKRKYVTSWIAAWAIVSMLKGETKEQYINGGKGMELSGDSKILRDSMAGRDLARAQMTSKTTWEGMPGGVQEEMLDVQTLKRIEAKLDEILKVLNAGVATIPDTIIVSGQLSIQK